DYIMNLSIDYKLKLMYGFAMLKIMLEQSRDDSEETEGAHEPQGQVACFPCFGPVSPCYGRQAGPPRAAPGCRRCLLSSRTLRVNPSGRVGPAPLLFSCYLQEAAGGLLAGGPWKARQRRHELFQFEPERVGLIGHLAASDRVDRRHHAAVAAEHAVGERHEAAVGRRRRRGAAKLARDRPFVATRVERAGRG